MRFNCPDLNAEELNVGLVMLSSTPGEGRNGDPERAVICSEHE